MAKEVKYATITREKIPSIENLGAYVYVRRGEFHIVIPFTSNRLATEVMNEFLGVTP